MLLGHEQVLQTLSSATIFLLLDSFFERVQAPLDLVTQSRRSTLIILIQGLLGQFLVDEPVHQIFDIRARHFWCP